MCEQRERGHMRKDIWHQAFLGSAILEVCEPEKKSFQSPTFPQKCQFQKLRENRESEI